MLLHKGSFYQQIERVAMGLGVSPAIANLVMEKLEKEAIPNFDYRIHSQT